MMIHLSIREALNSIYGAFHQLEKGGLSIKAELIAGVPLLVVRDPRITFLLFQTFSSVPVPEGYEYTVHVHKPNNWHRIMDLFTRPLFGLMEELKKDNELRQLLLKEAYFAFTFYDKPYHPSTKYRKVKEEQLAPFLKEFTSVYGDDAKGRLWVVRVDWFRNYYASIPEIVTELIVTLYFRNKGYLVRGDIGKMMDIVAFDLPLVGKLRELSLIKRGASLHEIPLSIVFGSVRPHSLKSHDQMLAIEVEAFNPEEGRKQLHEWLSPSMLKELLGEYCQPFERAIVAIPKFYDALPDVDVLTFDEDGIHYVECMNVNIAERTLENRECGLKYLKDLIRTVIIEHIPVGWLVDIEKYEEIPIGSFYSKVLDDVRSIDLKTVLILFSKLIRSACS